MFILRLSVKPPKLTTLHFCVLFNMLYRTGVPINNVIEDNIYCHKKSLNASTKLGFVDQTAETARSWLSSISNNRQTCDEREHHVVYKY